jgi:HEAT repeat protein
LRIDNEVKLNVSFHLELMDLQAAKQPLCNAAVVLGQMGKTANAAVPALMAAAKDPDAEIREAALAALKKIQGDNVSK